jgi:hypothetical protein
MNQPSLGRPVAARKILTEGFMYILQGVEREFMDYRTVIWIPLAVDVRQSSRRRFELGFGITRMVDEYP